MACGACGRRFHGLLNILFLAFVLLTLLVVVGAIKASTMGQELLEDLKGMSGTISLKLQVLALGPVALWSLILLVALLGIVAACTSSIRAYSCHNFWLSLLTVIMLGLIVLMWLAKVFLEGDFDLKGGIEKLFNETFELEDSTDQWNTVFIELKCCGINDVTVSNNDFKGTVWWADNKVVAEQKIPASCCKDFDEDTMSYANYTNYACTRDLVTVEYYYNGCYPEILKVIYYVFTVGAALGCTILILLVISLVTGCRIKKELVAEQRVADINTIKVAPVIKEPGHKKY